MQYGVEFVCDEAMPEGRDFVLVQGDEWVVMAYRQSAVCPEVLEDSWAAFRAVAPELLAVS